MPEMIDRQMEVTNTQSRSKCVASMHARQIFSTVPTSEGCVAVMSIGCLSQLILRGSSS